MISFTNRKFRNPNYHMPNYIPREKTQDDLDREKRTQYANSIYQSKIDQQNQLYDELIKNSTLNPPEYPIKTTVKENNYYDFVEDNTGSIIYASSFEDAISKVKSILSTPDSVIQKLYDNSGMNTNNGKLRLSSQNKGIFRSMTSNLITPFNLKLPLIHKYIDYWNIILSDAPPSTLSNYRISNQKNYNKGGKSKKKFRKSKKTKKNYKKSKKTRRTRRR